MKKNYASIFFVLGLLCYSQSLLSQCATTATLGTASNMFTLIRNGNHPIVVDKTMNLIAFIHRNDASFFGGNSGELRFDYSTNAGSTWTLNEGVLNPLNSDYARYPNLAIHNPSNNLTPTNAYVSFLAPTITSATSLWNGVVAGQRSIGGAVPTESYNPNGLGLDQIPHSLVKGAPGVYWAIEPTGTIATGYKIYQGVWNSTVNDIAWNVNYTVAPSFASGWTSAPQVVDYNIAFDPTGQVGYFSFLGHLATGPTAAAIYPILYKTTNGGQTWSGPITINVGGMGCISANIQSGTAASCNVEHDLIVDVNGNPHVLTTAGGATNYVFNYGAWHHMFDFTLKNGVWVGHDLGNVNGAPNTFGISPNIATHWQAPQAARSADGTKLFFTWTDNTSYNLGAANSLPDLFGKGYNVSTNNWTPTKNFTSCNAAINGRIWFPHMAAEVLEPSASSWKLAGVYGQPTVANDLISVAQFYFLDNLTFSAAEFSIAVPNATVTIAQGPTLLYCPGSTVNVNVTGAGEVIWSNSVTTNPLPVVTGSISTYSVNAQVGCLQGTASINVTNLSVTAAAVTPSICPGNAATFTVSGNALSYSWLPGAQSGTTVTMNLSASTVTLVAMGSSSCTVSSTVAVNILPTPTISIAGSGTTCIGYEVMQVAAGAQSYQWSTGASGATHSLIASTNTVLNVIGTAANSCTSSANFTLLVYPTPTVSAAAGSSAICVGQSVTLIGSGSANSYSWNGMFTGPFTTETPTATSEFTLTGSNNFGCEASATVQVLVNGLPTLSVLATRTAICKGEKQLLTANGASSYTWLPTGITTPTLNYSGTQTGNFTLQIVLQSAEGCTNTGNFALLVSACTGVEETDLSSAFAIWPNPSNGHVYVSSQVEITAYLYDQLGRKVLEVNLKPGELSEISDLGAGVYFLRTGTGRTSGKKLIIQ